MRVRRARATARSTVGRPKDRRRALAGALLAVCLALPAGAAASGSSHPLASATLEQCVTAVTQNERSATFAGEMTSIPGAVKMEIRIDVLERLPRETSFHTVAAAGLGTWSVSAPHVKVYKYLNKVTNLSAPAFYRGAVRFRWLNGHGRVLKTMELRTPRCQQPAPPATSAPAASAGEPVSGASLALASSRSSSAPA
jgi:hypothetical protein